MAGDPGAGAGAGSAGRGGRSRRRIGAALERLALWVLQRFSPIVAVRSAGRHRRSTPPAPTICMAARRRCLTRCWSSGWQVGRHRARGHRGHLGRRPRAGAACGRPVLPSRPRRRPKPSRAPAARRAAPVAAAPRRACASSASPRIGDLSRAAARAAHAALRPRARPPARPGAGPARRAASSPCGRRADRGAARLRRTDRRGRDHRPLDRQAGRRSARRSRRRAWAPAGWTCLPPRGQPRTRQCAWAWRVPSAIRAHDAPAARRSRRSSPASASR